jgi:hypothetical protein
MSRKPSRSRRASVRSWKAVLTARWAEDLMGMLPSLVTRIAGFQVHRRVFEW